MKRRVTAVARLAPPAHLLTFTGATTLEKLGWIEARQEWWDSTHESDEVGDIQWVIDGWNQIGDLPWCGSTAETCGDRDCMCVLRPDHLGRPE